MTNRHVEHGRSVLPVDPSTAGHRSCRRRSDEPYGRTGGPGSGCRNVTPTRDWVTPKRADDSDSLTEARGVWKVCSIQPTGVRRVARSLQVELAPISFGEVRCRSPSASHPCVQWVSHSRGGLNRPGEVGGSGVPWVPWRRLLGLMPPSSLVAEPRTRTRPQAQKEGGPVPGGPDARVQHTRLQGTEAANHPRLDRPARRRQHHHRPLPLLRQPLVTKPTCELCPRDGRPRR